MTAPLFTLLERMELGVTVSIFMDHNKRTPQLPRTAQQCLHLGTAGWGYRTAVSRQGSVDIDSSTYIFSLVVLDICKVTSVNIASLDIQKTFCHAKNALKKYY